MNFTNNIILSNMTTIFDHNLQLVEQIVLGSIFVIALIGNTLVLIIMLVRRHRRLSRMAFFIVHLTIADLLVAFFSVLPMLIWKSTITFHGGDILCRIVAFLMLTVTYNSVYTLVVMAYDRYQAIVHPLSTYTWAPRSGLIHMIGVWCISLLLATPQLFIFRLAHHPTYQKKTCMAKFLDSKRTWELIYISWTIILQFLIPICILIFCYISVYIIVNRSFSMYRASAHLKTTNTPILSSNKGRKYFDSISTSSTNIDSKQRPSLNNHGHIDCSSIKCQSRATIEIIDKSSLRNMRDLMYPVVVRLGRSQTNLSKNPNINSIDRQQLSQCYGAHNFLSRARLRTIKLTFIVVLTYILCSAPFYVGSIIMTLHGKFISQKTMNWLMTIFSLLFNLNSCSNPIICLILSGTLFRSKQNRAQQLQPVLTKKQRHNTTRNCSKHSDYL